MKSTLHKTLAVHMVFIVMLSTLSFAVDMHFCGKHLVDFTFAGTQIGCGMEKQTVAIDECSIQKKDCCTDKNFQLDGQDDLKLKAISKLEINPIVLQSLVYRFYAFPKIVQAPEVFKPQHPPKIYRQLFKLHEVYII